MPVLRVGDEGTRGAGGRDLGVEERQDRRAVADVALGNEQVVELGIGLLGVRVEGMPGRVRDGLS